MLHKSKTARSIEPIRNRAQCPARHVAAIDQVSCVDQYPALSHRTLETVLSHLFVRYIQVEE